VAAGATAETDDLRAACDAAVAAVLAVGHDLLVVVGAAGRLGPYPTGSWGSLRPYGAPVELPPGGGEPILPLALTLGRWLLDRAAAGEALLFGVPEDAEPDRCREVGAALADRADRVVLLVMGDGTGRRTPKPGYLDDRAEPFDAAVAVALAAGDPDALASLDAALAAELLVQGRAAWQVLAGAAAGRTWQGTVTYDAAPYGVGYIVATWLL
jgi:hypothetical protein